MALKVTKAVTLDGKYYAVGDVIENPTSREASAGRLRQWKTIAGKKERATRSAPSTRRKKTTPAVLDGDPVDMPADDE